jgi:hypothetical protein
MSTSSSLPAAHDYTLATITPITQVNNHFPLGFLCVVATSLLFIALYWIWKSSQLFHHNASKRWNSVAGLQLYTWIGFGVTLFCLCLNLGVYLFCDALHIPADPTPERLKLISEQCLNKTKVLMHITSFAAIQTAAFVSLSQLFKFNAMYRALGSSRILRVQRIVFYLIVTFAGLICFTFVLMLPGIHVSHGVKSKAKKIKLGLYLIQLVIFIAVSVAWMVYGTRFVLKQVKLLHHEVTLSLRNLWRIYVYFVFPALIAIGYIALQLVCAGRPDLLDELQRLTLVISLLEISMLSHMKGTKKFAELLSQYCKNPSKARQLYVLSPEVPRLQGISSDVCQV